MAKVRCVNWSWRFLHLGWSRNHSRCWCDGNCWGANSAGGDQLNEADVRGRRIKAALAGHRGELSQARALLDDSDAATRCAALGALDRLDGLTAAELQAALNDLSVSVRRRALELAVKHPEVEIEVYLSDPDLSLAETAAFVLGERAETKALGALTTMASSHADELCRETAIAALGALAAMECADRAMILTCLLGAMTDRAEVRRRAVLGLFQFEEPEAQEAVEAALRDKARQVRAVASELLGVVGD